MNVAAGAHELFPNVREPIESVDVYHEGALLATLSSTATIADVQRTYADTMPGVRLQLIPRTQRGHVQSAARTLQMPLAAAEQSTHIPDREVVDRLAHAQQRMSQQEARAIVAEAQAESAAQTALMAHELKFLRAQVQQLEHELAETRELQRATIERAEARMRDQWETERERMKRRAESEREEDAIRHRQALQTAELDRERDRSRAGMREEQITSDLARARAEATVKQARAEELELEVRKLQADLVRQKDRAQAALSGKLAKAQELQTMAEAIAAAPATLQPLLMEFMRSEGGLPEPAKPTMVEQLIEVMGPMLMERLQKALPGPASEIEEL
jgi:chromosome segregation ATPase